MAAKHSLALALLALGAATALAADPVGVPGCSAQFAPAVQATVDGKSVALVLTGTALRQKFFFNVYAVGSYVQQGAAVRTPEQLAAADCPKRLELVMERGVDSKEMADSFRASIRQNCPEPMFNQEIGDLVQFMQGQTARKGDHIIITHVPGVGLQCDFAGRGQILIKNPALSRAVWDIYLGRNNLGEGIKKGLASRL